MSNLTSEAVEATMASEATKVTVIDNMHMYIRVIKFADIKSKLKLNL